MKLIDKAAVVADIEKRIKINKDCMLGLRNLDYYQGKVDALNDTISFIDTLEVKEVDLEKEYKDFVEEDPVYNKLVNGIVGKAIAKHFFELGLKAKAKNIWHGANKEEPKIGKAFATIDSKWVMCAEYHVFEGGLTFKQMKEMDEIVKWAYTDDLIPKD